MSTKTARTKNQLKTMPNQTVTWQKFSKQLFLKVLNKKGKKFK